MLDAGYYVYNWVELGLAYSDLVRKRGGGTLAALYRDANMGDDNGFAIYNAVQCSDVAWPGWARTRAATLGGAPPRAVPDLGQHLVQRAVPDLEGAAPRASSGSPAAR